MNFQRGYHREDPEINLIPLIDVLLVILIFLMVTTTYARFSELQINLPQAEGDTAKQQPAKIEVNVDTAGSYMVNNAKLVAGTVEALSDALTRAANGAKEPVVVISADGRASHQSVIRVMDAARRVGYSRVTFVTQASVDE